MRSKTMICPNCNMGKVWEKYYKNDEDIWVREIICPVCYHHDILEVSEDESLEDFAERMSQRIQYSIKFDMINCFRNKREYTGGYLLEDTDGSRIHIDITIKPDKGD